MSKDLFAAILVMLSFTAIISGGIGFAVGKDWGAFYSRDAAIKVGVAYWDCDPLTGKTTFNYRKPENLDIMELPPKQ